MLRNIHSSYWGGGMFLGCTRSCHSFAGTRFRLNVGAELDEQETSRVARAWGSEAPSTESGQLASLRSQQAHD